jgi:hypothetical protein
LLSLFVLLRFWLTDQEYGFLSESLLNIADVAQSASNVREVDPWSFRRTPPMPRVYGKSTDGLLHE